MHVPVIAGRRAQIVDALRAQPGLSRRALARELGVHETGLAYHLAILAKERVVIVEFAGRSCAHFVNGTTTARERKLLLLSPTARLVLDEVRRALGTLRGRDVARRIDRSLGEVRVALEALERAGFARRCAYGKWEAAG